jgi:hypothetical protein
MRMRQRDHRHHIGHEAEVALHVAERRDHCRASIRIEYQSHRILAATDTERMNLKSRFRGNAQDSNFVVSALDMAIKDCQPAASGTVHVNRGSSLTSWAFTNRIRASRLMPSFRTIGDCLDNSGRLLSVRVDY